MTQRPFLPPSHDNVVNARGVMMSSALNKVMSVQEQSYDDFLNSFTYLSKGKFFQ
ncbi:hypothetical protein FSP39_019131 [Pinctada imbricata]|uniref:Uncharacterized protein n=1 Tax=Pinctada imbricata TaxID=66713 RepID=A0AA89CB90_PINIB|nr:hypothetical protein FSP39_019131 [Pinctada imbricata]